MIKKLALLATTALFSLNATAGYVQYNFDYGKDGGLRGYVVQHDTDQSIATFDFWLGDNRIDRGGYFSPTNSEGCICIIEATTYFRNNGPTNFVMRDGFGDDHQTDIWVDFSRSTQGRFMYTVTYRQDLYYNNPKELNIGTLSGIATRGTVDPHLANYLDSRGGYEVAVDRIVPEFIRRNDVPEPTSIALFTLGAAGLARIRRRKAAR